MAGPIERALANALSGTYSSSPQNGRQKAPLYTETAPKPQLLTATAVLLAHSRKWHHFNTLRQRYAVVK